MDNVAFFTYTHTNCKDVWPVYVDLLQKYCQDVKNYMCINEWHEIKNSKTIFYDDSKNYCQEFARMLQTVNEDYVIYMQEDFLLYDYVKQDKIKNYINVLENTDFSFIRLIKCGQTTEKKFINDLYFVTEKDVQHSSIYSFSMQPTIWKRKHLIDLYKITNLPRFGESLLFTEALNKLNMNGLYCFNNEKKRGISHYDSYVFPYIATAIVKKKWNTLEYNTELQNIFKTYNIDSNIRGENI